MRCKTLQGDLFNQQDECHSQSVILPPCVELIDGFIDKPQADSYYSFLQNANCWDQPSVTVYGKQHPIPRLQAWFGDLGLLYEYSGKKMQSRGWIPPVAEIKEQIEQLTSFKFNSCLANFYRNGGDTMGWHSDDEPELGSNPVVACVSFGVERPLMIRHKQSQQKYEVNMPHGSLLIMKPGMQASYQHHVPQRKKIQQSRISLTFRLIHPV